jgi:hypothetical protein
MYYCKAKRGGGQAHVRVVGKAESFLGYPDQVAIKFGIAIFIMDGRNAIITGRQVFPHNRCLALTYGDGSRSVSIRFIEVLGPPFRRGEEHRANDSVGISETINMNTQRAAGSVGGGTILGGYVRKWCGAGKHQENRR